MNKFLLISLACCISLLSQAQTDQLPSPEAGQVLMKIRVTDWDDIPESEARIVVKNKAFTYDAEGISDIDGHWNLFAPNGDTYNVDVYKFDTVFHFVGIEIPKEALVGIEIELQLKIKIVTSEYISISQLAVHFNSNDYQLDATDKAELDKLVNQMKEQSSMKIEIAAHTDNVGDDTSNMRLSQQRANSVKNYLLKSGITDNRIVSKGYGEERPIADNISEEGKAKNRRVECRVISQ